MPTSPPLYCDPWIVWFQVLNIRVYHIKSKYDLLIFLQNQNLLSLSDRHDWLINFRVLNLCKRFAENVNIPKPKQFQQHKNLLKKIYKETNLKKCIHAVSERIPIKEDKVTNRYLPVDLLNLPAFLKYVNNSPPQTYSKIIYKQQSSFVDHSLKKKQIVGLNYFLNMVKFNLLIA